MLNEFLGKPKTISKSVTYAEMRTIIGVKRTKSSSLALVCGGHPMDAVRAHFSLARFQPSHSPSFSDVVYLVTK